ncbi:unnamed protein product [Allacma fusca]|uniref:Uncharacterized protein n=1 Tax=Allacma fusca TaxID=39272 RepID=A0A8J2JE91_9HEXA|nr:unnamed protein product [Allacma fusca]
MNNYSNALVMENKTGLYPLTPEIYQVSSGISTTAMHSRALQSLSPWTFFPVSNTYDFTFISVDGVERLNAAFVDYLLSPLELCVWIVLGLTLGITCLAVTIVNHYFKISGLLNAATETFLWIYAVLVENLFREYPTVLRKDTNNKRTFLRFYKIILGVWLLAGLVITNGYKGLVKSNLSVAFPFTSKFQYLSDLTGFKYYIPMETCNCTNGIDLHVVRVDNLSISDYLQKVHVSKDDSNLNLRKYWTILGDSFWRHHNIFGDNHSLIKLEELKVKIWSLHYFCENEINGIVDKILVRPKTALVTTRRSLSKYWKVFKAFMRKIPTTVFVNNGKYQDQSLADTTSMPDIFFTSKIGPFKNWVLDRMKVIFHSGLYNHWISTKYRISDLGDCDETNVSFDVPKSLKTSDVWLIYLAYFILTLTCIVEFFIEVIL